MNPFAKLRARLSRSRDTLRTSLTDVFKRRERISPETIEELEEILLEADLGPAVAERLTQSVSKVAKGEGSTMDRAMDAIRSELESILSAPVPREDGGAAADVAASPAPDGTPHVVLVIGVNGTGKTTTIAKLAQRYRQAGNRVVLAAADTFRAAAIDQLAMWAERADVDIVRALPGSDPAAVAYDAVEAAISRGADTLIVDTAGRLHTRDDLREELSKIARVIGKKLPGAPHEVLLVLDATTGQTAIAQAELFSQTVPITGLVVTKLDGTARAGIVVAVRERLGIPVQYIGVGETLDDLQDFDAAAFAEALIGREVAAE